MTDQDVIVLTAPPIETADVEQEVALLELQGKRASRSIIRKKLAHYEAALYDFTADIPSAEPMEWGFSNQPSFDTIQAITDWALSQSAVIQDLIFSFLEDPSEDQLKGIICSLKKTGVTVHAPADPCKERSLTEAIIDFIGCEQRSITDLYELGRSFITSRRPEAAVRQTLRRLIKAGQIEETNNVYRLS